MILRKIIYAIFLLLLTSCASTASKPESIHDIPENRIQYPDAEDGAPYGTLVFVRDFGIYGIEPLIDLYIDGRKIASFHTDERAVIKVRPGKHKLSIQLNNSVAILPIVVTENIRQNFRLSILGAYSIGIESAK
jgi:hypothetical protein